MEVQAMESTLAASLVRQCKINKALYDQYGGRIIYRQLGQEPLDAFRQFLEQRQSEGVFAIQDPALADGFWNCFTDQSIQDFMEPSSADAMYAFKTPPWEKEPWRVPKSLRSIGRPGASSKAFLNPPSSPP